MKTLKLYATIYLILGVVLALFAFRKHPIEAADVGSEFVPAQSPSQTPRASNVESTHGSTPSKPKVASIPAVESVKKPNPESRAENPAPAEPVVAIPAQVPEVKPNPAGNPNPTPEEISNPKETDQLQQPDILYDKVKTKPPESKHRKNPKNKGKKVGCNTNPFCFD